MLDDCSLSVICPSLLTIPVNHQNNCGRLYNLVVCSCTNPKQQDSIRVGRVPPLLHRTCISSQLPDVSTGGPQVNKFEQVTSLGHQISLGGRLAWRMKSKSKAPVIIVTKKLYLPAVSSAGGNNR